MGDYKKLPTDLMLEDAPEDASLWELLSVYADGEATPAEAAQVESLLRSDSAVKREFDFMRLASSFVAAEPELAPPTELRDRIFAATVARPTLRRRMATAWADFAASLTPRYALAGGLAGAALLTVALWPHAKPANNKGNAPQIAQATQHAPKQIAAVTPPVTQTKPSLETAKTGPVKIAPTSADLNAVEKTPAKPTGTTPMAKTPAQIAAVPAPKTALAANRVKPTAPKHPAMVKAPQAPATVEPDATLIAEASYSPKPDMDRVNQRPAPVVTAPDTDAAPDDRGAETSAPPRPTAVAMTDAPFKPQHYEGHLKLPSDDARQMTPSFMRQQRQALRAGYNDLAISSIRQNQIRLGTELRF